MALIHIVAVANDGDLQQRIAACVIAEGDFDNTTDPLNWAATNRWALAASPGWGDAYDSAQQTGIGEIGTRGNVITDSMILSAVQARLTDLAG